MNPTECLSRLLNFEVQNSGDCPVELFGPGVFCPTCQPEDHHSVYIHAHTCGRHVRLLDLVQATGTQQKVCQATGGSERRAPFPQVLCIMNKSGAWPLSAATL